MFLQCATDIFAVGYNLIAVEHLSHLFIHSDNGSCDGEGEVKKRGCKHTGLLRADNVDIECM